MTELTLEFLGTDSAEVTVTTKAEKKDKNDTGDLFRGTVAPGEEFSFSGLDKNGTMGTEIQVYVDGELDTKIHTSCSKPIGPGMQFGDFLVVSGRSLEGGELCGD